MVQLKLWCCSPCPWRASSFLLGADEPREVKCVFSSGTVAFFLVPSLPTQALRRVMQLLLSTSYTLKGVSLPCAVVFCWTLVWTKEFVLMGSAAVREGKSKLVLTALISAQLKLPEESGIK